MKKIFLITFLVSSLFATAQQGNSPYPTTNGLSYANVNPRYYISGVQGSVSGAGLNYSFLNPTFATKSDTIWLLPGAYGVYSMPTDSLGNALQSDTNVVYVIKSPNGGPAGSYPGDVLRIQVPMGTYGGEDTKAGISGHVLFRNLANSGYFQWTTGADSTERIYCGQTLILEFMNYDGSHWIERSKIIQGTAKN